MRFGRSIVGMGLLLGGCAYQGAPFGGYYGGPGYVSDPGFGGYPSGYQWQRNELRRQQPLQPTPQRADQTVNPTPRAPPVHTAPPANAAENRRLLDQLGFKPNN